MQICTNMSWSRHYQGRLMLFRGVTYMCVLYNVVSEYHSVQIPRWGGL